MKIIYIKYIFYLLSFLQNPPAPVSASAFEAF